MCRKIGLSIGNIHVPKNKNNDKTYELHRNKNVAITLRKIIGIYTFTGML